ncbi:MAG: cation-translocating P-type ATPase [Clostridiales bacterium]|nr:cation-translocating P-type ATPase [Clostridiales bacterium]
MAITNTASSTLLTTEAAFFHVEGIVCYACVNIIESAAKSVPGVTKAAVSYIGESLQLDVLPETDLEAVISALGRRGYKVTAISEKEALKTDYSDMKRMRVRIIVSFFLSLLVVTNPFYHINPWVQFAAATIIQVVAGRLFYRDAFYAVSIGSANMSVLVSIGALAAYVYSTVSVFTGSGLIFYESTGTVLVLVMIGKYLERSARISSSDSVKSLMESGPTEATLITPDGEKTVPCDSVKKGDIIVVKRGAFIPADGIVIEGTSAADESGLTGESRPADKGPGDKVFGATINISGRLVVSADSDFQDNVYSKMRRALMNSINGEKAEIQRLCDRVVAKFIPAVLGIAVLSLFLWYGFLDPGNFTKALVTCVAVLIVACPCAMGIATPLAVTMTVGELGKSGIFVKNPAALELLAKTDIVVFDKTGTLTIGPEDRLRAGAPKTVETLGKMGIRVLLLSGDREDRTKCAAGAAGITEYRSGLLPEDKAALIAELRKGNGKEKDKGHIVTMVGDGVNDALSISSADVGIAIGKAAEVSLESADAVITQNRIAHILKALYAGRVMIKNIKHSLFWALIYNSAGLVLAACGIISPVIAGAAMSLSSLSVVLNARSLEKKFYKITFDKIAQS